MTLGRKIKELRSERSWTQNELAKRSGIDRSYLAYLETDRVKKPSGDTFLKLARAFNISPDELYLAAGYIKEIKPAYSVKESPRDALDRTKMLIPEMYPVYEWEYFPVHAGEAIEPVEYYYRLPKTKADKSIEGYVIRGNCLNPIINDYDIIIIDRDAPVDNGDIVAIRTESEIHIAKLKRIDEELWLENNHGQFRLQDCKAVAKVIEKITRF